MKRTSVSTLLFFVTLLVVVLIFTHLSDIQRNIIWLQVPVSLVIGFLLGIAVSKKKRTRTWY